MLNKYANEMSVEELEILLEKKKMQEKLVKLDFLDEIDFTHVKSECGAYIETLNKNGFVRDDDEHFIFESAMEACFGKSVWAWINKKSK